MFKVDVLFPSATNFPMSVLQVGAFVVCTSSMTLRAGSNAILT